MVKPKNSEGIQLSPYSFLLYKESFGHRNDFHELSRDQNSGSESFWNQVISLGIQQKPSNLS